MPDFSKRSYEKELLDRTDIPFEDIKRNMQELETINTLLGGHKITIAGLKRFIREIKKSNLVICEIGCGGGDNLKVIDKWCRDNTIGVKLIGIDINKDCIEYAKENCALLRNKEYIVSDYRLVNLSAGKPDIIFSSLFTHHLDDEQFIQMLKWCSENSISGFFINDLHRHFLAYYSIKVLTGLFSKSYLVKNDAPLSVRRGFKKKEIKELLKKAGINHFAIEWKWAFRWLVNVLNG
jgi:2-polyprenyl-3-methyl-5-hydroxy-6-metoxy-1,4-benzoquinol methylase